MYSSSNCLIVLPHSKEGDSRIDSQKSEPADFSKFPLCILPSLLSLSTTKKFKNIIVAKKKVILKPRFLAFMDFLVVTIYDSK